MPPTRNDSARLAERGETTTILAEAAIQGRKTVTKYWDVMQTAEKLTNTVS